MRPAHLVILGFATHTGGLASIALALMALSSGASGDEYNLPPIAYADTPAQDPVATLDRALQEGRTSLAYDARFGYLPALFRALAVPSESQMLVFSKTSQQKDHISPDQPRSLYFSDDVYIGRVPRGEVLEIAATDPRQGMMFYVLSQTQDVHPRFIRKNDECLICHDAQTFTGGVPGLMMRSVFPDAQGQPILKAGTFVTDQTSPIEQRWGGWYVTGHHGTLRHLGNMTTDEAAAPEHVDREHGANRATLSHTIDVQDYPEPGSDIVALLVLAHQTQMHNRITVAGFSTRVALVQDADLRRALGRTTDELLESTKRRIANAGEDVLRYLLFCGETPLTQTIVGSSAFAEHFSQRGPRDEHGRSLYQLDLTRRLLRYPCSYLIYSDAFDALPGALRDYLYRRLGEIVTGTDHSGEFTHLNVADRQAIYAILCETKPTLAKWWRSNGFGAPP